MDGEFARFCGRSPAAYADLRRRIDACAQVGRSCEFPRCRMPEGCDPPQAVLGFFRQPTGYLMYFRPRVEYRGPDRRLAEFFSHGERMLFPTFGSFEEYLGRLPGRPAPFPQEAREPSLSFAALQRELSSRIVGQTQAVQGAAFRLWTHISKQKPARPLSLMLFGPTGVGKSQLAKEIAPALNRLVGEKTYSFVWTEMNTFTEAHSAYRLTGAPPGYTGYEDAPVFEAVRHNPKTVFMFDELEKAHPQVLKVFMSILDEGRIAARRELEGGGRELDFRQAVLLFTTNADLSSSGARRLGFCAADPPGDSDPPPEPSAALPAYSNLAHRLFQGDEAARRAMIRQGVLAEIAGRFGGFLPFHPLSEAERTKVTLRQIAALGQEHGLSVTGVSPALLQAVTPQEGLSARSAVAVLEGVFTAAFCQYAHSGGLPQVVLSGTAEQVLISPARLAVG